ncbi:hypothetical protein [Paractinoplanes globisporus]|uniref:hypothetical protein n=1 Tax=Paractinoplanes globisporus TaxID=113565 RepID=UPI0012FA93FB|nr:hypothetical protein [Actinoplanes globisporus]
MPGLLAHRRLPGGDLQVLEWLRPVPEEEADGRLVVADLFYADGPNLYATAADARLAGRG